MQRRWTLAHYGKECKLLVIMKTIMMVSLKTRNRIITGFINAAPGGLSKGKESDVRETSHSHFHCSSIHDSHTEWKQM